MLRLCLYPHARSLAPLLAWLAPEHLSLDRDFIRRVGAIRQRREFGFEANDFIHSERSRSLLRRLFRLRVSVERVRRQVESCWNPATEPAPDCPSCNQVAGDPKSRVREPLAPGPELPGGRP